MNGNDNGYDSADDVENFAATPEALAPEAVAPAAPVPAAPAAPAAPVPAAPAAPAPAPAPAAPAPAASVPAAPAAPVPVTPVPVTPVPVTAVPAAPMPAAAAAALAATAADPPAAAAPAPATDSPDVSIPNEGVLSTVHDQSLTAPGFMDGVEDHGVMGLDQFIIPPRIKVVQPQSGAPFDDLFEKGEVIAVPQLLKIAGMLEPKTGQPFYFTPVFFFPEWCLWNPYELKGTLPAIRQRTTDPQHVMAAKSRDPQSWLEACPENKEFSCRYVEHLNFVVALLEGHELAHVLLVLSFARAEHRAGSNFAALIKMRRAPMFGCQFQGATAFRVNSKGQWFGIDVTNPARDSDVSPFCQDPKRFKILQSIHEDMRKAHKQSKIHVDYDDQDVGATPANAPNEF